MFCFDFLGSWLLLPRKRKQVSLLSRNTKLTCPLGLNPWLKRPLSIVSARKLFTCPRYVHSPIFFPFWFEICLPISQKYRRSIGGGTVFASILWYQWRGIFELDFFVWFEWPFHGFFSSHKENLRFPRELLRDPARCLRPRFFLILF
jgi:hypothetical protein